MGAIGVEVVCLLLVMAGTFYVIDFSLDSFLHASYGLRASGAVATFVLWSLTAGGAAFVALRRFGRTPEVSLLGAVFIVAVINGLLLLPFLAYTTWINGCTWHVTFPLGGDRNCG